MLNGLSIGFDNQSSIYNNVTQQSKLVNRSSQFERQRHCRAEEPDKWNHPIHNTSALASPSPDHPSSASESQTNSVPSLHSTYIQFQSFSYTTQNLNENLKQKKSINFSIATLCILWQN